MDVEFHRLISGPMCKGGRKVLLHHVSGKFQAGMLNAIMGPSGAGKSTLMNALTGFQDLNLEGNIFLGGKEIKKSSLKKSSTYIMQQDVLHTYITVLEAVTMSARFNLHNLDKEKQMSKAKEVIKNLGLEDCQNQYTQRISNGQKKRLSIALELVTDPPLLYLDEPTTGLDQYASHQLTKLLKMLAEQGRTIICTVHQPSALMLSIYDHLYVLANGYCVYQGAVRDLVSFLTLAQVPCSHNDNPADFIIEAVENDSTVVETLSRMISNGDKTFIDGQAEDIRLVTRIPDTLQEIEFTKRQKQLTLLKEIKTMCHLLGLQEMRNTVHLVLRIACTLIIITAFSSLYYQTLKYADSPMVHVTFTYAIGIYFGFINFLAAIVQIPSQANIVKKETFNHWYRLHSYYIAVFITRLPVQTISNFLCAIFIYYFVGLPLEPIRFIAFLMAGCLLSITSDGIGLCFGSFQNSATSTAAGTFLICPTIGITWVGTGHMSPIPLVVKIMHFFIHLKCGINALYWSLFGFERGNLDCSKDVCVFETPVTVLKFLRVYESSYWLEMLHLFGIMLCIRILGYFLLLRKDYKNTLTNLSTGWKSTK